MSAEARCHNCGKLLGETDDTTKIQVSAVAVQADMNVLRFTIKCPRCGRFNIIKFER